MASVSGQPGTGVDEVADGVFRISTPVPMDGVPGGFTFNQYLVLDDEPLLFHTGPRRLFPAVREAVARVLPVDRLRWIGLSHVEADECGALNEWLAVAPHATPLCGRIAAAVSIGDLADRAPRALGDGESLSLGSRGPSEAFRRPMDYYAHARDGRRHLERLAALRPTTLACMHGSAWRGDGGALLRALADAVEK